MRRAGRPADKRKDMILIALGSNLPFCGQPPADIITCALRALEKIATVAAQSRLYDSPAWPDPTDPPYVNAVARIETGLGPEAFLAALHALEAGFGRRRGRPNASRTLDLDLLDYNGLLRQAGGPDGLVLPHPRIQDRGFVLAPLAEIAPGWRHPVSGKSAEALMARLNDRSAWPVGVG